ncbi:hypothetical protein INT45_011016 [Circinella minor]|uniref:HMG box domain-containing protein n=1 Tax=Circinella minor TaxID=1195481 RepID=A0A8H7SDA6_9FUNG|nr:hypothetical protein INT45_011016 [Circinella minor]
MDAARNQKCGLAIQAIAREAENVAANLHKLANLFGVSKRGADDELRKQTKKRPKLVDPKEPEKPKRAYNYFIKENYPVIQKQFPDINNRENMKELAALWRKTRGDDKKHYEDLAYLDKERYDTEYKSYIAFRLENPYDPEKDGVTINTKKQQQKKQAETDALSNKYIIDKEEEEKKEERSDDSEDDRVATPESLNSESSGPESSEGSQSPVSSSSSSISLPIAAASHTTSHVFDDNDDDESESESNDTEISPSTTKPANIPKPKLISPLSKETQNKYNNNKKVSKYTKKKKFLLGKKRRQQRQRPPQKQQLNGNNYDNKKKTKKEFKWYD